MTVPGLFRKRVIKLLYMTDSFSRTSNDRYVKYSTQQSTVSEKIKDIKLRRIEIAWE